MIKDLVRRPVSRLIAFSLTFGMLGVGMPSAEAAGRATRSAARLTASAAKLPVARVPFYAFVEMDKQPGIVAYAKAVDAALAGQAGDEASTTALASARALGAAAARGRIQELKAAQAALRPSLEALGARIVYSANKAVSGFAVRVDATRLAEMRRLPGVKGVHPMSLKETGNSTSVPFLGLPQNVWDAVSGKGATGAGVSVGVIDTGIDYQHAMFGGTGLEGDYAANDRTVISEVGAAAFPTAKVVGGVDLAGDAYNANDEDLDDPSPDADPMDCNGHGTHVAGTTAGLGVNGDGTTFAGPYDATATAAMGALRIGPGTAPAADLYAIRVFGCKGSTSLTAAGLEWAMDPNDDDDLSDHLDVINMSLGSNFGSLWDESVVASNNAAAAGIVVVASAGNAGDVYFITGAPGGAEGVVAVAASTDALPTVRTTIAGPAATLNAGTATFGPQVGGTPLPDPDSNPSTKVDVVLADDGSGAVSDGCCGSVPAGSPYVLADAPYKCTTPNTWTNAAAIAGKIALVDRGTCEFAVKAYNAQQNGAIGVIIANNQGATATITMGGSSAAPEVNTLINVPTASITQNDGVTVKANLTGLQADMILNPDFGNTLASFSSRGPRRAWGLKPDVAAPGSSITSSQTGIVCDVDPTGVQCAAPPTGVVSPDGTGISAGSKALILSGTSMAAPHVAGIMATLRQLHPTWKPAQLRGLLISTSSGDIFTGINSTGSQYGPGRVGAGLVNPGAAARSQVVLGQGTDFLSFGWEGPLETFGTEIVGAYNKSQNVMVKNLGATAVSFDVSYVPVVNNPGVAVTVPASIALAGKKQLPLKVTVSSTGADSVAKTRDASVATTQAGAIGTLPREFLGEESGYIVLTPTSGGEQPTLHLPLYLAPRPASKMKATKYASPLKLTGAGFLTPSEDPLVTSLEWQASDADDDFATGDAVTERLLDVGDLQNVGVANDFSSGGTYGYFGISTWGNWSTPNEVEFDVKIDVDRDGTADWVVFNSNTNRSLTLAFASAYNDAFISSACTLVDGEPDDCFLGFDYLNGVPPGVLSIPAFNNNTMVLGIDLDFIGATERFDYWVESVSREGATDRIPDTGHLTYDPSAPGLDFNELFTGSPWWYDLPGETIPHAMDATAFAANGSLGALLLHHHNTGPRKTNAGTRAETLPIDNWVSVGDASIAEGSSGYKTLNFTVSLTEAAAAGGGVMVTLQTADDTATAPSDYQAKTQTVTIPAGQTSKTFSVRVYGDINGCGGGDDTGTETFFVNITSVVGAAIQDGQAVGTIESEEPGCP